MAAGAGHRSDRSLGRSLGAARRRGFAARLLLGFASAVATALLGLAAIALLDRWGWLPLPRPPPHFVLVPDPADSAQPLRDGAGHPLYAIDPAAAARHGQPDVGRYAMAREKTPGLFRVLSIGESTTFGAGFAPHASYSRFLEARLRRQLGRDDLEVVNCGKNGYDSHDWPTLAQELPAFAPDLLLLYVGHNELKKPNLLGVVQPSLARRARSRLLQQLLPLPRDTLAPPPRVAAGDFLSAEQRAFACELLVDGVAALLDVARNLAIPVVVCLPASNVADHPPRYSRIGPGPDAAARAAAVEGVARAIDSLPLRPLASAPPDAPEKQRAAAWLAEVERALAGEPEAALLHWRRGRLLLALGRRDEARTAFGRSLALDGLPERAAPDLIAELAGLAEERGALRVELQPLFDAADPLGVAGDELFYDYCHPRLFGHWRIADALLATLRASGLVAPESAFDPSREPAGDDGARYSVWCRELAVSEAQSGQQLLYEARAVATQLGTLPTIPPEAWRNVGELLDAALRLAPALERDPFQRFLAALVAASAGARDDARARLLAFERDDPAGLAQLLPHVAVLPGLVDTLRKAGIAIDSARLAWEGKP